MLVAAARKWIIATMKSTAALMIIITSISTLLNSLEISSISRVLETLKLSLDLSSCLFLFGSVMPYLIFDFVKCRFMGSHSQCV